MNNETARNPRPPAKTAGRVPTQNARTDNERDFPLCGRFLLALAFWVGMRPAVFLPVGAVFITAVHSGWVRVPLFLPAGAILRSPAAAIFHFVFVLFPWTQVLLLPCGPIAPRQQLARATAVSVL